MTHQDNARILAVSEAKDHISADRKQMLGAEQEEALEQTRKEILQLVMESLARLQENGKCNVKLS